METDVKKILFLALLLTIALCTLNATPNDESSSFLVNVDNLSNEERIKALQPYRKALDEEVKGIFKDNDILIMGSVVRCCVLKNGNFGIQITFTAIYPEEYVYSGSMYSEKHAKYFLDNIIELIKPICNTSIEFWEIGAKLYCPNYANIEDVSLSDQLIVTKKLLFNSTTNEWAEQKYE